MQLLCQATGSQEFTKPVDHPQADKQSFLEKNEALIAMIPPLFHELELPKEMAILALEPVINNISLCCFMNEDSADSLCRGLLNLVNTNQTTDVLLEILPKYSKLTIPLISAAPT